MPQKTAVCDLNGSAGQNGAKLLPRHCREAHITYGAPLHVSFVCWRTGDESHAAIKKTVLAGHVPVMVKSNRCSLSGTFEVKQSHSLFPIYV